MQGLFDEFIAELKTKDAAQIKKELKEMEEEDKAAEKSAKKAEASGDGAGDKDVERTMLDDEKLFDYVISNPPYQVDISKGKERSVGTRTSKDVFPDFHKLGVEMASNVVMIYPATWQKKITAGFGKWLFDNGLKSAYNYDAYDVFSGAVKKGILVSVLSSSDGYVGDVVVNGSLRPRNTPVWINSERDYVIYENTSTWTGEFLSGAASLTDLSNVKDSGLNFSQTPEKMESPVRMYIKKNPGKQADAGYFYVEESQIRKHINTPGDHYDFTKYNVLIQSAVFGRQSIFDSMIKGRGSIQARVFEPRETAGLTLASLRSFDIREEAEHFAAYMNTKMVSRLLYFDYSKRTFASFVPDLGDYTSNNPDIDWDEPLEPQLLELFGIDECDNDHF